MYCAKCYKNKCEFNLIDNICNELFWQSYGLHGSLWLVEPSLGILHFFWKWAHFTTPPEVEQLSYYRFWIHSADFLIFRRISVTRQFLVSLASIVFFIYPTTGCHWDQKLSGYWYSSKYQKISWNGETQLFNSGGVVKWAYCQKKWSIPLRILGSAVLHRTNEYS